MKKKFNNLFIKSIKTIKNPKGNIFKILSSKESFFDSFGDCYISQIKPKQIKAWRCHKYIIQRLCIISGYCKLVIFYKGKFRSFNFSEKQLKLLIIPKNFWYGFKNIGNKQVKILNITNKNYLEKDIIRKKIKEIKYNW